MSLTSVGDVELDAVINVFADYCEPNFSLPWQMQQETKCIGSGFAIFGRRILTNAHCIVTRSCVVRVKKRRSHQKYIASILEIGHECDLALLAVEDDDFWKDLTPLTFGSLPKLQEKILVIGYPTGGENICISAGVVSRIQLQSYSHANGLGDLLSIQVDAAINSGNSGGPALNSKNEVVGMAFQSGASCSSVENIGYLIPESIINHFLSDFEGSGRFRGFCDCGFEWQRMDSPSLRRYFDMKDEDSGVLVRRVKKTSPAREVLRKDDIIVSIDGVSISNAGTVPFTLGEPISFHYIVTKKHPGNLTKFRVIRDGQYTDVEYGLRESSEHLLVPVRELRVQPEYFILAGIVFVVLTTPYLEMEYGSGWRYRAPYRLQEKFKGNTKESDDEQIVVVSQVLSSEITVAHETLENKLVSKVNGAVPKNLMHLSQLVDECASDFVRFELDEEFVVVIDLKEARKASEGLLERHAIPSQRSIGNLPLRGERKRKRQPH